VRTNDRNETIKERGVGERRAKRRITCRGREKERGRVEEENILLFSNPEESIGPARGEQKSQSSEKSIEIPSKREQAKENTHTHTHTHTHIYIRYSFGRDGRTSVGRNENSIASGMFDYDVGRV